MISMSAVCALSDNFMMHLMKSSLMGHRMHTMNTSRSRDYSPSYDSPFAIYIKFIVFRVFGGTSFSVSLM
jgi:hypothetical protein